MQKDLQIFGTRAIIEAIEAGKEIDKVFLQKGLHNSLLSELNTLIKKHGVQTSYVPVEKLNKLTQQNHQGAIAIVSAIKYADFERLINEMIEKEAKPLFLLLDGLSDVRNFGAIIRTAECTGVHGIIIPKKGGAPVNGVAIKTSAGAAFNIPIAKVDHIKDAIYYLQGSGVSVVAATEKTDNTLFNQNFNQPLAIVMGREDSGVSPGVLKLVDHKAKLPLQGTIASLNVSVACGAFLYEVVRQRL
ncbi:23S rRNA (guanosine(2251)-2'-O)-methyltransferase RlmB [Dokdonia sp. Hel_I_53]|uniref:23S rRNA (guanosine(2251)-2'-O)-methyltransferase RlmB n=1 Tax=Dokdonia sp. Hel_I_53 TaxID=1566287 RepID=UPI00119BCA5B|nr:23S rRNA (guanosine(2251)-2'-O)-methyltransferase RlmB [Dokdonia sp. Hel_I_53]TVZ52061.1 23S rRNA (guanosine2251-2'-O)-methyltransferase [Dokdonia sp. Hel_I_53]